MRLWVAVTGIPAGILAALALAFAAPERAAAQGAEAAACNEKPLPPGQIRCFLDAAMEAGDPAICEGAEGEAVRFNCLSLYAERRDEPAVCDRVRTKGPDAAGRRAACIAGVAVAQRRPGLCEETGLPVMRDACYAQMVLKAGGDPALCARIQNVALRQACQSAPAPAPAPGSEPGK